MIELCLVEFSLVEGVNWLMLQIVPIEKGKKKGGEDEGGASLKNHINNGSDMVETGEFSKEEPQVTPNLKCGYILPVVSFVFL